jgi:hypothetical protein
MSQSLVAVGRRKVHALGWREARARPWAASGASLAAILPGRFSIGTRIAASLQGHRHSGCSMFQAGRQPPDRQGPRPPNPAGPVRPRRRGDRIERLLCCDCTQPVLAHGCPEPMRRHVRSWRKRTSHRHRNTCGSVSASPCSSSLLERRGRRTWQCPHSAEGDMRALNEGSGF